jgi:hypothetical protein
LRTAAFRWSTGIISRRLASVSTGMKKINGVWKVTVLPADARAI